MVAAERWRRLCSAPRQIPAPAPSRKVKVNPLTYLGQPETDDNQAMQQGQEPAYRHGHDQPKPRIAVCTARLLGGHGAQEHHASTPRFMTPERWARISPTWRQQHRALATPACESRSNPWLKACLPVRM